MVCGRGGGGRGGGGGEGSYLVEWCGQIWAGCKREGGEGQS